MRMEIVVLPPLSNLHHYSQSPNFHWVHILRLCFWPNQTQPYLALHCVILGHALHVSTAASGELGGSEPTSVWANSEQMVTKDHTCSSNRNICEGLSHEPSPQSPTCILTKVWRADVIKSKACKPIWRLSGKNKYTHKEILKIVYSWIIQIVISWHK